MSAHRYQLDATGWPRAVVWGLGAQLCLVTLVFVVAYFVDRVAAVSGLLGGFASLLPNAYFALRVFGKRGGSTGKQGRGATGKLDEANAGRLAASELGVFYRAEVGKLASTAVLLALTFSLLEPLNAGALVGGFVMTHLGHVLVMFGSNRTGR